MSTWESVLITILSGLIGGGMVTGISALIRARSGAAGDITEAAGKMVKEYRTKIDEQGREIASLLARVEKLEKLAKCLDEVLSGAHLLVHQVRAHGDKPVYVPPDRDDIFGKE